MEKKFTGTPITDITKDKENDLFFFLLTGKKGVVRRYENKSLKKLKIKRGEIFNREAEKEKKKFLKKLPTERIKKLKKSAPVKKSSTQVVVHSGSVELIQLRKKVILEAKIKGLSDVQIKELISDEFEISPPHVSKEIRDIEGEIRGFAIVSHEEILLSHISRYENLYAKFRAESADGYAMKALRSKENVAGLHDQTVNIQVNNYMDNDFNISILPKEKQQRIKELLIKIKVK